MSTHHPDHIRAAVRAQYAAIAKTPAATQACCTPDAKDDHEASPTATSGCCGPRATPAPSDSVLSGVDAIGFALGYRPADLEVAPEGSNMGLGCGNPHAIARLERGERVLDLGSGGGLDCFLAARQVGPQGHVIGVDMTPEMVHKARAYASNQGGLEHVDFRLGGIERLPVASRSVDVILSNCVINLSPDQDAVFHEAYRVLKPGGRLAISDVVALKALPSDLLENIHAVVGCIAQASTVTEIERLTQREAAAQLGLSVSGMKSRVQRGRKKLCERGIASSFTLVASRRARWCH